LIRLPTNYQLIEKVPDNPEEKGLRPFSELRNIFDKYKSR